jgi:hypothetical protein
LDFYPSDRWCNDFSLGHIGRTWMGRSNLFRRDAYGTSEPMDLPFILLHRDRHFGSNNRVGVLSLDVRAFGVS